MRYDMPIVETKRCVLRPLEESDACDMYAYCSDELVMRYLSMQPHPSVDYTHHFITRVLLPYGQQQDFETWAIVLKENDTMIGYMQFHSFDEDRAQIAYVLHRSYWNQGIMKEALQEMVRVGFTYNGLRRLEALYEVHHEASARVLAHCGFMVEGRLKEYMLLGDNKYHDMILVAILEKQWKEQIK